MKLNIKHNHISIGDCENYDKEKNTMAQIPVWVFRSTSGCLSKELIVARDLIG